MASPSFIFLRECTDGSIYRDNYYSLYRKETRIVITKKVYVTVFDHEKYENVVQELNKLGVNILEKSYNVACGRYDILTEMNVEQCCTMLTFVNKLGGILWKGE